MEIQSMTPVLVVDAIEDSLDFWEKRLGFERAAEVPHEGRLGFVLLMRYGVQLMIQSRASVEEDLGLLTADARGTSALIYIDVPSLEPIKAALKGVEVVVGERRTFYGAREIFYREPNGHVVGFAARAAQDPA